MCASHAVSQQRQKQNKRFFQWPAIYLVTTPTRRTPFKVRSSFTMETRARKRRDSDSESIASACSEPAIISRSRSTTPFTLRSQCTRHGSECPEGHGINFRSRLSPSPSSKRSSKKSPKKTPIRANGIRKTLLFTLEEHFSSNGKSQTQEATKKAVILTTSDYSSADDESVVKISPPATPLLQQQPVLTKISPIQRYASFYF